MITNSELTIYHKNLNNTTHSVEWERINYDKVWFFGGKGSSVNKGYDNANNVDIRIPFPNVDVSKISIGDILVKGRVETNITSQSDLNDTYNITSININDFGLNPHIHIGGR